MKNRLVLIVSLLIVFVSSLLASDPDIIWTKAYTASKLDFVENNEYIFTGNTKLNVIDGSIVDTFSNVYWYYIMPDKRNIVKTTGWNGIPNAFRIDFINLETHSYYNTIQLDTNYLPFKYMNGDSTLPPPYSKLLSSNLSMPYVNIDSSIVLCVWGYRGYIEGQHGPEQHDFSKLLVVDIKTRSLQKTLDLGDKLINADIKFSPDGKYFVVGYVSGEVEVWDAHTFQFIQKIGQHAGDVRTFAFSPNNQFLMSGGSGDGNLKIYNAANFLLINTWNFDNIVSGCKKIEFIDNNKILVSDGVGVAGFSKTKIIDILHYDELKQYQFMGTSFDITNNQCIINSDVNNVVLFNIDTNKTDIKEINTLPNPDLIFPNPGNNTLTVKFNLPGSASTTISLTNDVGSQISTISSEVLPSGANSKVLDISLLPAGTYFVNIQSNSFFKSFKFVKE